MSLGVERGGTERAAERLSGGGEAVAATKRRRSSTATADFTTNRDEAYAAAVGGDSGSRSGQSRTAMWVEKQSEQPTFLSVVAKSARDRSRRVRPVVKEVKRASSRSGRLGWGWVQTRHSADGSSSERHVAAGSGRPVSLAAAWRAIRNSASGVLAAEVLAVATEQFRRNGDGGAAAAKLRWQRSGDGGACRRWWVEVGQSAVGGGGWRRKWRPRRTTDFTANHNETCPAAEGRRLW